MTLYDILEQLKPYRPHTQIQDANIRFSSFEPLGTGALIHSDILYFIDKPADFCALISSQGSFLVCASQQQDMTLCSGNFIWISDGDAANAVFDLVCSLFRDEHRLAAFGQQMLSILSKDGSLQKIVDEAFLYIGNPIVVFDPGFSMIAANWNEAAPDHKTQRILRQKYMSPADMEDINRDQIHDKVMKSDLPLFIKNPSYDGNKLLIRLAFNNKIVGHIAISDTLRPFSAYDQKAAVILRDVIIQCLQKDEFIRNSRGFNYEYLIADLLDGKITLGKNLQDRLSYVDFYFEELLYITVAELGRSSKYVNPTYVINKFEQLLCGSRAILYNGQILLVTTRSVNHRVDSKEIEAFNAYCRQESLFCGMSNPFRGVANLPKYYTQALRALELGTQNESAPALYTYADYAVSHITAQFLQKENPMVFCHPAVKRLLEYDSKKNGNLIETLYQYLLWERNLIVTAQKMYLHRNTLGYRLKKIQELTDLDLNDAKTRQYLLWSLYICRDEHSRSASETC